MVAIRNQWNIDCAEVAMKSMLFASRTPVSAGHYQCLDCGHVVSLETAEQLPECPEEHTRPHIYRVWIRVSEDPEQDFFTEHSDIMEKLFSPHALISRRL
jgi:hypothetical protein